MQVKEPCDKEHTFIPLLMGLFILSTLTTEEFPMALCIYCESHC